MEANWKTDSGKVNFCNTCDWNVELGMKFGIKTLFKIKLEETWILKISTFKHSAKINIHHIIN